jgi:hypothetical protein
LHTLFPNSVLIMYLIEICPKRALRGIPPCLPISSFSLLYLLFVHLFYLSRGHLLHFIYSYLILFSILITTIYSSLYSQDTLSRYYHVSD